MLLVFLAFKCPLGLNVVFFFLKKTIFSLVRKTLDFCFLIIIYNKKSFEFSLPFVIIFFKKLFKEKHLLFLIYISLFVTAKEEEK